MHIIFLKRQKVIRTWCWRSIWKLSNCFKDLSRSTGFIFDLYVQISGCVLSILFHTFFIFSVSSCWTLSTGRSLVTTIFGDRRSSQNLDLLKSWIFSQMENGFFQSMDADAPATDVVAQDTKSPDVLTPDMVAGLPALMKLNIEPTTFQDLKEAPGVPPTKRSSLCRIYSDFISEINSDQSKVNRPNQSRKKSLLF